MAIFSLMIDDYLSFGDLELAWWDFQNKCVASGLLVKKVIGHNISMISVVQPKQKSPYYFKNIFCNQFKSH